MEWHRILKHCAQRYSHQLRAQQWLVPQNTNDANRIISRKKNAANNPWRETCNRVLLRHQQHMPIPDLQSPQFLKNKQDKSKSTYRWSSSSYAHSCAGHSRREFLAERGLMQKALKWPNSPHYKKKKKENKSKAKEKKNSQSGSVSRPEERLLTESSLMQVFRYFLETGEMVIIQVTITSWVKPKCGVWPD